MLYKSEEYYVEIITTCENCNTKGSFRARDYMTSRQDLRNRMIEKGWVYIEYSDGVRHLFCPKCFEELRDKRAQEAVE